MMKYIYIGLWLAALWLMSASEQGLIGNIGVWISLAIFLSLALLQNIAGKVGDSHERKQI